MRPVPHPPRPARIASLIIWRGRYRVVGLVAIAALARRGLTPLDCETIALVADQYRIAPSALLRLALHHREVRR